MAKDAVRNTGTRWNYLASEWTLDGVELNHRCASTENANAAAARHASCYTHTHRHTHEGETQRGEGRREREHRHEKPNKNKPKNPDHNTQLLKCLLLSKLT